MLVTDKKRPIMPETEHNIRLATDIDLSFIVHLQRIWSNQVGFLPRPALMRYIDNRSTLLVELNKQHAGYLSWQLTRKGLLRLNQLAIDPALLRGKLGTDIVTYIEKAARRGSCSVVRFQTRIDLDANLFFNDLGYKTTAIYHRPTARRRPLIEWTKCLLDPAFLTQTLVSRKKRYQHRATTEPPTIQHPKPKG